MDFRNFSKWPSTRLAIPTTVLTPQLENYLFNGFSRDWPMNKSSEEGKPFILPLNLASVMESDLKITRTNKSTGQDILRVEVAHLRREAEDVHPFTRDCTYRFILPENLRNKTLAALWTVDHYLIVVESSRFIEELTTAEGTEKVMDVEAKFEDGAVSVIKPRKVDYVFKPTVDIDVLRQSVALSEYGLFHVNKIIQNSSFTCPDVGRPVSNKSKSYTFETEKEVLPYESFHVPGIDEIMEEHAKKLEEEKAKEENTVVMEEKIPKEDDEIIEKGTEIAIE